MLGLRKTTDTQSSSLARKTEHAASGDSKSSPLQRLLIGGLSQSHLLAFLKEASGEVEERSGGVRWSERKVTSGGGGVGAEGLSGLSPGDLAMTQDINLQSWGTYLSVGRTPPLSLLRLASRFIPGPFSTCRHRRFLFWNFYNVSKRPFTLCERCRSRCSHYPSASSLSSIWILSRHPTPWPQLSKIKAHACTQTSHNSYKASLLLSAQPQSSLPYFLALDVSRCKVPQHLIADFRWLDVRAAAHQSSIWTSIMQFPLSRHR